MTAVGLQAAAGLDSRPVTPALGSVVRGVDLARPLTSELAARLRALLLDRGVLVFPGQHALTRGAHVAFARCFGPVERLPNGEPSCPEIVRIVHGPQAPPTENIWHSDLSFLTAPPLGAALRAIEVPEAGGDTLFADMRAAWRALPPDVQAAVWELDATHDIAKWADESMTGALHDAAPPQAHPIVRIHPETGDAILNVNRAYTTSVLGLAERVSASLLDYLCAQVAVPEVQCRIRWRPDTVILWDNRMVQHYATGDYLPSRRIMERVTILGDRVAGPQRGSAPGL